jgi:hypothetical protein
VMPSSCAVRSVNATVSGTAEAVRGLAADLRAFDKKVRCANVTLAL